MILRGSKAWVHYLDKVEFPLLSASFHQICELTDRGNASISQLSHVLMKDANLSSSVLRLANSVFYNPSAIAVNTLNRAIIQVGFDAIKSIAISSLLVDKLRSKTHQQALYQCLSKSFTAAVTAKYLATKLPKRTQEEIFVAALLYHIGEAAFWASSHPQTDSLAKALKHSLSQQHQHDHQWEVLGTHFKSISRGLVKQWSLGQLLDECLDKPSSLASRLVCNAVHLCDVEDQAKPVLIHELASLLKTSHKDIEQRLEDSAQFAEQLLSKLGVKAPMTIDAKLQFTKPVPDTTLELEALQKMASMAVSASLNEREQLSALVHYCLKGLIEGAGLIRVGLFLAKPAHHPGLQFQLCKSLGQQTWQTQGAGPIQLTIPLDHPFYSPLQKEMVTRITADKIASGFLSQHFRQSPLQGVIPCLIAPVVVQGHTRGFLYADALGRDDFTQEQCSSMHLFAQQLVLHQMHQQNIQHTKRQNASA